MLNLVLGGRERVITAILPNLAGFLVTVKRVSIARAPALLVTVYSYAWFVGFGIAFCLYIALRVLGRRTPGIGAAG